jgi:hypothetical protein
MFWVTPHTLLAKPHEKHFATPCESTSNTIKYKSKTKKNKKLMMQKNIGSKITIMLEQPKKIRKQQK